MFWLRNEIIYLSVVSRSFKWQTIFFIQRNTVERILLQVTDWKDEWMSQHSDNFWEDHQLRTMTGVAFLARAKVLFYSN